MYNTLITVHQQSYYSMMASVVTNAKVTEIMKKDLPLLCNH